MIYIIGTGIMALTAICGFALLMIKRGKELSLRNDRKQLQKRVNQLIAAEQWREYQDWLDRQEG